MDVCMESEQRSVLDMYQDTIEVILDRPLFHFLEWLMSFHNY